MLGGQQEQWPHLGCSGSDGSRVSPAGEGAVLECRDEQVMEPGTAFADFTSLPSTTVGSHGSGSQTDRGWGNLGRKPP